MREFLYFSAPWCGPCKMFGPIMDKVSSEGIPVKKINVDENKELALKYGVMSVPTTILLENGNPINRFYGAKSLQEIKQIYGK